MKTLKRSLSLFLVLALCLSLVTIASAASYTDFPDADDVTYDEAMDVLVAIGVINGKEGNLAPTDLVTREEAAKMIAYICLGATAAEALSTSTSPFSDVASGRWSAGYIAYCASQNIINGTGDGSFNPTGYVTRYQFVKMLLAAVGYGANSEFVGESWAIQTATWGFSLGAFSDSEATSYDSPATREEAMLYAFNVLTKVMKVKYSSVFDSYYSGSSPLVEIDEEDEYLHTLGYTVYGLEKSDTTENAFGCPFYVWEIDGDAVSQLYYTAATLSYTTTVTSGALYTALGKSYAGTATYIVDGVEQSGGFDIVKNRTTSTVGGRGVLTIVYADSDTYDVTIVEIDIYLALVTDVDDDVTTVTVYGYGNSYDGEFETDDFDDGDYVLVTIADGEIQTMAAAQSFTGTMDAYSSSYLKVDGTVYYINATYGSVTEAESATDYSGTYTFFLDSYGYLLGNVLYEASDANLDYVYVYGNYGYASGVLANKTLEVGVYYMDGTSDVLNVYVNSSGKFYKPDNSTNTSALTSVTAGTGNIAEGYYRYSIDDDGYVTLKPAYSSATPAVSTVSTSIEVTTSSKLLYVGGSSTGKYTSSSTVLTIIDDDGDVTTLTGYSNFKGYSDSSVGVLYVYSGSIVTEIYVMGGAATSTEYAYCTGASYTDSEGTWYTFYIAGESHAYQIASGTPSGGSLYAVSISGDYITLGSAIQDYAKAKVTAVSSLYFTTANETVYYDDDAEIYDATAGGAADTVSVGDYVVYDTGSDGLADVVYIVSAPSSSGSGGTTTSGVTISAITLNAGVGINFTDSASASDTLYATVKWLSSSTWVDLSNDTAVAFSGGTGYLSLAALTAGNIYRVYLYDSASALAYDSGAVVCP